MVKKYLGLDCSTQSLTALVLEQQSDDDPASTRIVHETSLNFDQSFPEFGTRNGVLAREGGEVHTPPQLWVRALERILERMRADGLDMASITAIGVSGQQHASVYLNDRAEAALGSLEAGLALAAQLEGIYSRPTSPIWMDASTGTECREITAALGGDDEVCRLTGSRAFERFTGPQIRKFFHADPAAYASTRHICLVSSFLPSLLAGKIIPVDPGDGAGMNLMDINAQGWSPEALAATAPGLDGKLLPVVPSDKVVGVVSRYFVSRYGFNPACQILPGTGDNPSSLIGLGLVTGGRIGVSLGTSDTLFAYLSAVKTDPAGASNVFGSPTGAYMCISVYKNGSLAREAVRQRHGLSWDQFSDILARGEPGNGGKVMLPYFDTEIIPRVPKPGVRRFGFGEQDVEADVRAVIEAQMTSMRIHGEWMGEPPRRIYATGGASSNRAILQVMADVFDAPVSRQETANSACLGAALRAQHGHLKSQGSAHSWEVLSIPHVRASFTMEPNPAAVASLAVFREKYRKIEGEHLNGAS